MLVTTATASQPVVSTEFAARRARAGRQTVLAGDEEFAARARASTKLGIALAVPGPVDLALLVARLGITTDSPSSSRAERESLSKEFYAKRVKRGNDYEPD